MNNNLFCGFECEEFKFEDTVGYIAKPDNNSNRKIAFKTEYWGAFPELEKELLIRGFHVIHMKTDTRLANRKDCDKKARFVEYAAEKYNLDLDCVLIGFSCGGAQAVNFATFYPNLASCLVIDAPVLNFLDFPARYNAYEEFFENEFKAAYPNVKRSDIFMMQENPINNVPKLIEEKIPVIMLYGTEDKTVDYFSNGKLLEEAYSDNTELLTVIPRKFQGHHPHGLLEKSYELAEMVISKLF